MSSEGKQRIILLPEDLMEMNLLVICLKHPRTGSEALCAIDSSNKLFEIIHHNNDISSWFVDESVSDNGSMYFLTVADPLFFILPYATQNTKYCPIENLFLDENFSDVQYLSKCCKEEELQNVYDSKELAGYKVYSYDEKKTLLWLQQKARTLAAYLRNKDIDLSQGFQTLILRNGGSKNEEEYLTYACYIISEYLSDELSCKLFSSLGLERTEKNKRKRDDLDESFEKQNVKEKCEGTCSEMVASQEIQKKKLTTAQKQLMKVDKTGMKNISSFFQKK